jgi:6-pyruvoyltetrahydropterin/6-carboxytetrahydropterin synthase
MYSVAIQREFVARHFLFGGDWGPENFTHAHQYRIEVAVSGPGLDTHGYLIDIVDLETRLEKILTLYQDRLLNDLPQFDGLNPSIEHLARIIWSDIRQEGPLPYLKALTIKIWENDQAWASYSEILS